MISISDLKCTARGNLLGHFRPPIYSTIVSFLVSLIIYSLFFTGIETTPIGMATNIVAVVVIYFFIALMYIGRLNMHLGFARNQEITTRDMWFGFRGKTFAYLGASLIVFAISFVCMLPFMVCYVLYTGDGNSMPLLVASIIFAILGAIAYIIIMLRFMFAFMVLVDIKISTVKQAFIISSNITKGRRKKLFATCLSFIGLYVLSILSFGLGFLWTLPYLDQTLVAFYLEASKKQ